METTGTSSVSKSKGRSKTKKNKVQQEHVPPLCTDETSKECLIKDNTIKLQSIPLEPEIVDETAECPCQEIIELDVTEHKCDSPCSCPSISQSIEQQDNKKDSEVSTKRKKKKKKKKKVPPPNETLNTEADVNDTTSKPSINSLYSPPEEIIDGSVKTKKKKKKKKKPKSKPSEEEVFSSVANSNTIESKGVTQIVEAQISVHPDEEIVCDIHIGNPETHPLNFDVSVPSKSGQNILTCGPDHLSVLTPVTTPDSSHKHDLPLIESRSDTNQEGSKHKTSENFISHCTAGLSGNNSPHTEEDFSHTEHQEDQASEKGNESTGDIFTSSKLSEAEPLASGSPVKSSNLESAKRVLDEVDNELSTLVKSELLKHASESIFGSIKQLDQTEPLASTSNSQELSDSIVLDEVSNKLSTRVEYCIELEAAQLSKQSSEVLDSNEYIKTKDLGESVCGTNVEQESSIIQTSLLTNKEPDIRETQILNSPSSETRTSEDHCGLKAGLKPTQPKGCDSQTFDSAEEIPDEEINRSLPRSYKRQGSSTYKIASEVEVSKEELDDSLENKVITESGKPVTLQPLSTELPVLKGKFGYKTSTLKQQTQLDKIPYVQSDSFSYNFVGTETGEHTLNTSVVSSSVCLKQNSPNLNKEGKGLARSEESTIEKAAMPSNEVSQDKNAAAGSQQPAEGGKTKAQLKSERRAAFEAQKAQLLTSKAKEQKSKAELRAERRALQEAQRAAKSSDGGKPPKPPPSSAASGHLPETKASAEASKTSESPKKVIKKSQDSSASPAKENIDHCTALVAPLKLQKGNEKASSKRESPQRVNKIQLFAHLPRGHWDKVLTKDLSLAGSTFHPAVIKLALQLKEGIIRGSNARCVALLLALKQVIQDYTTPSQKEMARDLEAKLKTNIKFLCEARPLSVSMINAVKHLQWHITCIPSESTDAQAKKDLISAIDKFIREEIILANAAISGLACTKINDGDVILTYACSSLVCKVLCDAKSEKNFHVIVVDARPKMQGREMLRKLLKAGISCSYVLINAVSYVMQEVTKVMLGAHSLQANGYVMSHVGSSQIALVAHACNVPVLVCCETYKFSERVQTDSFVYNELGNSNEIIQSTPAHLLGDIEDTPSLQVLNLVYDITPPDFVSVVITEKGMLPCTSVPAVLRMKQTGPGSR